MDASNWLNLLGIIAGTVAFLAGLVQYRKGQEWKKAEFAAAEIKEFESKPYVTLAMSMLDYNDQMLSIFPERENADKRQERVTDELLKRALRHHAEDGNFTPVEARIRRIFDDFLGGLQRIEHFISSGLVTHNHFRFYLSYWLEILAGVGKVSKRKDVLNAIWLYIDSYGYPGVQKLFLRYGYDIQGQRDY